MLASSRVRLSGTVVAPRREGPVSAMCTTFFDVLENDVDLFDRFRTGDGEGAAGDSYGLRTAVSPTDWGATPSARAIGALDAPKAAEAWFETKREELRAGIVTADETSTVAD